MTSDKLTLRSLTAIFLLVTSFNGCGRSVQYKLQNKFDAATSATKAVELYDRNRDGKLTADEVKASPGLSDGGPRIDANRDGVLKLDEIQARLRTLASQSDFILLRLDVSLKRKPLAGASVTFTPEPFMGDGLQAYVGTSSESGGCDLKGEAADTLGIPVGFYQVKIVHPGHSINVVRGVEIADDTTGNRLEIAL
jgi:hypothetical protein